MIKAISVFELNGVIYEPGDEVEVSNFNDLVKLNEKGFIEPLSAKKMQSIKQELNKDKIFGVKENLKNKKEG